MHAHTSLGSRQCHCNTEFGPPSGSPLSEESTIIIKPSISCDDMALTRKAEQMWYNILVGSLRAVHRPWLAEARFESQYSTRQLSALTRTNNHG